MIYAFPGSTVTLLYNAFGPRIEEVGIGGMPDTTERTMHRVDLVASQALPEASAPSSRCRTWAAPWCGERWGISRLSR